MGLKATIRKNDEITNQVDTDYQWAYVIIRCSIIQYFYRCTLFTHPKSALRNAPFYGYFRQWVSVQVPSSAVVKSAENVDFSRFLALFIFANGMIF